MEILRYPFDSSQILKKKRRFRRELLESDQTFLDKKIAILGGSTVGEIRDIVELFLLQEGIRPVFYESEYGRYWEDAVFENPALKEFSPDIIFIHTSSRNIVNFPQLNDDEITIDKLLDKEFLHFSQMWNSLRSSYHCPIIQNNFERPFYRIMGNRDIVDPHGRSNFVSRLNQKLYDFARANEWLHINDIDFLSASFGLAQWADPFYWHMYKYTLNLSAIPEFSYNLSNIIKAIYGKNKKAFVLDLDNTLWGGVVGDDGVDRIQLGPEASMGQAYVEFQSYIKEHLSLGILLTVNSKNEEENALAGLSHPYSKLQKNDFAVIKANWNNKDQNIKDIAFELNIGEDSLVFVDDNPTERAWVQTQIPAVETPEISSIEQYIRVLDRNGYFEVICLSEDDRNRARMYADNAKRNNVEKTFENYYDYLTSLAMIAKISHFNSSNLPRITQLTNKTNQFNLTTKRFSEADLSELVKDENAICLSGQLQDQFGDNGIVSVIVARKEERQAQITLWLMSCRVFKRDMEFAMLDELILQCKERGVQTLFGYYYKTDKNKLVKEFYGDCGFEKIGEDQDGNSKWKLEMGDAYLPKNNVIKIVREF